MPLGQLASRIEYRDLPDQTNNLPFFFAAGSDVQFREEIFLGAAAGIRV
jgi:hypothetical protein